MAHSVAAISAALVHGSAQGPSIAQASAVRALQQELKKLKEEPVEGFIVQIPDEANMFEWEVAIFGSPGSLYEGGYFKVSCHFCCSLLVFIQAIWLFIGCYQKYNNTFSVLDKWNLGLHPRLARGGIKVLDF